MTIDLDETSDSSSSNDAKAWPAPSLRGVSFEVDGETGMAYGGSFFHAPLDQSLFTINLMKEYPLTCDHYLPIRDYSIPTPEDLVDAFEAFLNDGRDLYVGCFAGIGRTGLFLASLLTYLGEPNALARVRAEYNPHACETPEQEAFVRNFPYRRNGTPAPTSSSFKP